MNLTTLIDLVKRRNKFGDHTVTSYATDRATADIINALNNRMHRLWRAFPWDWSVVEISQAVLADVSDVTFGATIGRILSLTVGGQVRALRPISFFYYHEWKKGIVTVTGIPQYYIRIGRTSNNLKVRTVPTTPQDITLNGWGQTRITTYVPADVSGNTGIAYFPEEMHDLLVVGVEADILRIMGKEIESKVQDSLWEKQIQDLITEEQRNKPDETPETPAPDYFRRRIRKRGKGTIVV